MIFDGDVVKFPGRVFAHTNREHDPNTAGLSTALNAIEIFCEGWEPLFSQVLVDCPLDRPAATEPLIRPNWLLSRSELPVGVIVTPSWPDPIRSTVDVLSRAALETWVSGAIASSDAECGDRAEWRFLRFDAARARVGPADWRPDRSTLQLQTDQGVLDAPLERDARGTWLSGPRDPASDQAPLAIRILQEFGVLTFSIIVNYSFWLDPAEPAAAWLSAARARLEDLGWKPA